MEKGKGREQFEMADRKVRTQEDSNYITRAGNRAQDTGYEGGKRGKEKEKKKSSS